VGIWYTKSEEWHQEINFYAVRPEAGLPGVVVIEGHVQGLANARALGKAGIQVIVVSEYNCLAHYSKYCKKFFKCPDYLSGEFIDFLIRLALKEGITDWALLPSNDHAVYNISGNIERLQRYYKIISPKPEIFESIYNKELLIKLCKSINVPVPLSWFPENREDVRISELKFPLLLKGKNGLTFYKKTGKKAMLIIAPENFEKILDSLFDKVPYSDIFLQNVVPVEKNKAVSFTSFSIDGEIKSYWMGVKMREHPIQFGTATYSRWTDIPELVDLAEKLLRKLSFTGVCEIEFLLDSRDNEYKLIEVNARTWLWVDMAIKSGINYPLMIYNYLNNIKMDYQLKGDAGSEWIHYLTDIPYCLAGIVNGNISLGEIIKSYRKLPSPAVFDITDIMPSFAEIALLPFLMLRR
jgi:predicted ATP-grasp superfamily ATP-dependent carboligase